MKKFLLVILVALGLNANAQTADSTRKTFAPVDIYHGAIVGASNYSAAFAGYYLDFYMRRRLYLFTRFNVGVAEIDDAAKYWGYNLSSSIAFAFRLNGAEKKWNYFPHIGVGLVWGQYAYEKHSYPNNSGYYLSFGRGLFSLVGFEANCKLKNNHNLGFGIDTNPTRGFSLFFKYGWNRAYKHK